MVSKLTLALGAGLLVAAAAPSFAQSSEEIVVSGRYGKVPGSVQSLSIPVSYSDLDLSTQAGRDILRHRLNLTARFLCTKLGESDMSDPIAPSCRDAAVKDAMARVGTVEEGFAPRGTSWVAPSRWAAPYPADWDSRYP